MRPRASPEEFRRFEGLFLLQGKRFLDIRRLDCLDISLKGDTDAVWSIAPR